MSQDAGDLWRPALLPPEGEQERVHAFFGNKPSGFFVDVGANDPAKDSQSLLLERRGWQGILIEPQPDLVEQLRRERKGRVFAVACSSPDRAGQTLPLHVAGPHSSLNPNLAVAHVRAQDVIHVPVRTLDDILQEADATAPIDFLSVDVEGHEIEVLRGFDFAHWQPRLILLEDHVLDLDRHRFIESKGYRLLQRTGLNAWYIPAHAKQQPSLWGRWQLLRKYHLALPFRRLREANRRRRYRVNG